MLSTGRRHGLLTLAPSAAAVKRAVYLDFPKADTRGRRLGVDSGDTFVTVNNRPRGAVPGHI